MEQQVLRIEDFADQLGVDSKILFRYFRSHGSPHMVRGAWIGDHAQREVREFLGIPTRAEPKPVPRVSLGDTERCTFQRVIDSGGYAHVYKAIDRNSNATIAVKVLRDEVDPAHGRARFEREIRVLEAVDGNGFPRLIEAGSTDLATPWYSMEFLDGLTLKQLVERDGKVETAAALTMCRDICEAIQVLHQHGYVHRDIKPNNAVRTSSRTYLIDPGIAKRDADTGSATIATTGIVGTLRYMAPERLLGESATKASDVHALGLVLYYLTTGRNAFAQPDGDELLRAIAASDLDLDPVPTSIRPLVTAMTMPDPLRRPSVGQVVAGIELFLKSGPEGAAFDFQPDQVGGPDAFHPDDRSTQRLNDDPPGEATFRIKPNGRGAPQSGTRSVDPALNLSLSSQRTTREHRRRSTVLLESKVSAWPSVRHLRPLVMEALSRGYVAGATDEIDQAGARMAETDALPDSPESILSEHFGTELANRPLRCRYGNTTEGWNAEKESLIHRDRITAVWYGVGVPILTIVALVITMLLPAFQDAKASLFADIPHFFVGTEYMRMRALARVLVALSIGGIAVGYGLLLLRRVQHLNGATLRFRSLTIWLATSAVPIAALLIRYHGA